jgi:Putative transmembrane protein (PGPGW)
VTLARALRVAAGWSLLVVGALLLVLPGPGIPLLVLGLALLSRDVPWARRARERVLERFPWARSGGSDPGRPAQ